MKDRDNLNNQFDGMGKSQLVIEQLLRESVALYKAKKYRQTISVCDAIIQIDTTCAEAYCTKGMAHIGVDLYEEAVAAFECAEQLGLKVVQVYIGKGLAFSKIGRYDAGLMACSQAIQLDAINARAYYIKAQLHLCLKDYESSIVACEQAIRLGYKVAKIYITLGEALLELQSYDEALEAYTQAIQLDRKLYEVYLAKEKYLVDKGNDLFERGCFGKAIEVYEQVQLFNPNNEKIEKNISLARVQVLLIKGEELLKAKLYEQAANAYKQAIQLDFKSQSVFDERGKDLLEEGKSLLERHLYQEALIAFENAAHFGFRKAKAITAQGDALYQLKRYTKARDAYEEAILLDRSVRKIYAQRCKTLLEEGRTLLAAKHREEAYAAYENAVLFSSFPVFSKTFSQTKDALYRSEVLSSSIPIEEYAVHANVVLLEGEEFFNLKQYKEALLAYDIAILLQKRALCKSNNKESIGEMLIAKGEVLYKLKHYQAFLNIYDQVRIAYGDEAYKAKSVSLIEKARSLYKIRSYVKSYAAYKRAILFDPSSAYINDYKGRSRRLLIKSIELLERGHFNEAYAIYEGAIQFNPDNEHVASIGGKSLDGLKNLRRSQKDIPLSTEVARIEVDDADGEAEEPDIIELMTEGYDDARNRAIPFLDEVSDPDEYDENYNQHYERDLGDEIDASLEREGLL